MTSDARPPSDTGTVRCGCELPFRPTVDPHQCACGRWHVAVVFHDHEQGTSWTGWDLAPGTEATG